MHFNCLVAAAVANGCYGNDDTDDDDSCSNILEVVLAMATRSNPERLCVDPYSCLVMVVVSRSNSRLIVQSGITGRSPMLLSHKQIYIYPKM